MPEGTSLSYAPPPVKPPSGGAPVVTQEANDGGSPSSATAPAPAGQAPAVGEGVLKQLEAERVARESAEKKALEAQQSYGNLRTIVDRQGTSLSRIEQLLRSQGNAGQNAPGTPDPGQVEEPPTAGQALRQEDPDTQLLRFEMASTRYFTRDLEAGKRQDEIMSILRDPSRASSYAAYAPVQLNDGSIALKVDYEKSIDRVWKDLLLQDLLKQRVAPSGDGSAGTRTAGAPIGASATGTEAGASQGALETLTAKLKSGEISPEEWMRGAHSLGAVEIDPLDQPLALGSPLTPPPRGQQR